MMPHLDRIHTNTDWILPLSILVVLIWIIWRIYRHDSIELRQFWRIFLPILRTCVLLVLLWIYLQPVWITEKERKVNSRFLVFCDTSLSMTLAENEELEAVSRVEKLTELWEKTPFLQRINERHDIIFLALDSEARVIWSAEKSAMLPKTASGETEEELPNWKTVLKPQGTQSRLADGIREWIAGHTELPISGILLCSDGVQNSGGEMEPLTELAKSRQIPIYTLGFGSVTPVENYRITEMEAPARVLPKDPFLIRGTAEGVGFSDEASRGNTKNSENTGSQREIVVDLIRKRISAGNVAKNAENAENAKDLPENNGTDNKLTENKPHTTHNTEETVIDTQNILLPEVGKQVSFEFQTEPEGVGKYLYTLRIRAGEREQNFKDNEREAEVDVMERKTRVLIFAGGPMREYQFLATALYRDKNVETDVLLQSATPTVAEMPKNAEEEKAARAKIQQDATRILLKFPETREELFSYDCILAIDANWKALTQTQAEWVEEWTSRHGGGVIFIAGPVYMGMVGGWLDDPTLEKIRVLCPVEFYNRTSSMRQNTFTADEIWQLDWTRAGREAGYLQLDDQNSSSEWIWDEFPGVYGHFPTKQLRHGATSLANFSNPQTRVGDTAPILLATQFYGAGRTFYIGTGEFWRLRAQNPEYFTRFYTQILQYVTQGRTLQQSQRGRLMLAQSRYFPGDPIEIRAQLYDSALQPLEAGTVPEVIAEVFLPDGKIQSVQLLANKDMSGMYIGQFSVLAQGRFRVELPIPESTERLVQRGEIVLSDLERDRPQRNQRFLNELAKQTGGIAFENANQPEFQALPELLRDRTRTLVEFDSATPVIPPMTLLYILVGLLSVEWLLRRLLKLA
ncbi:MAG: hypothetical protein Q4C70_11415 [Planctomycetia bacterium]|nr:hypothetical protein [Planctomycetia bacterium]